ncbi:MAG: NAD-binding protein [bacterium]|nr:NAD-binding protein [bacterium]
MRNVRHYIPYGAAALVALNGFVNFTAGLAQVFQLEHYLQLDRGSLPYLDVTPGLQLGGFVWVGLGVLQIVLGKGLAERRRRSWWATLGALLALVLFSVLSVGPTVRTTAVPLTVAGLLIAVRGQFYLHPNRRRYSYGELVAGASVLFALAFGIVGTYLLRREFNAIENWTDAVYFTVVTYSTLGYGDILPVTENARLFTILMVTIGLSSFVTAITVVVGPLIEERIKGVVSVMSKFQKTIDHVVVCGYSDVTESIADELRENDVPFLIIEDREAIAHVLKGRGFDVLLGDAAETRTLEQANLPQAAAVIAATDSDATNILIAITARNLREAAQHYRFRILVRVEHEENVAKVLQIGVDDVISPSTLGGRLIAGRAMGR